MQDEVLPHYGNTHTTTSVTSLQTTLFRHEARFVQKSEKQSASSVIDLFVGVL